MNNNDLSGSHEFLPDDTSGMLTPTAQAALPGEQPAPGKHSHFMKNDQVLIQDGDQSQGKRSLIITPAKVSILLRRMFASPYLFPAIYLLVLTLAEALTVTSKPQVGMVLHGAILVGILLHATLYSKGDQQKFLATLALAPLVRLMSLTLPLIKFPFVYWYAVVGAPLFLAAYLVARLIGIQPSRKVLGLNVFSNFRSIIVQFAIGLSGLGLGLIEYLILKPTPLAPALKWELIWLPALILVIFTGLLEEVIFRGLMQKTAIPALGRYGIPYVSLVFAVLHFGYKSALDMIFVFAVALFFAWVVLKTGSLYGVTLAHGLTNVTLFLVIPFILPSTTTPVTLIASTNVAPLAAPATQQVVESIPQASANPTATVPYSHVALILRSRTSIHQGPGSNYKITCYIDAGNQLIIIGRNNDSSWLRVTFGQGQTCYILVDIYRIDIIPDPTLQFWISASTSTISGDLSKVAIITPTPTALPIATRPAPTLSRTPTVTPQPGMTNTPTQTTAHFPTDTPIPSDTPVPPTQTPSTTPAPPDSPIPPTPVPTNSPVPPTPVLPTPVLPTIAPSATPNPVPPVSSQTDLSGPFLFSMTQAGDIKICDTQAFTEEVPFQTAYLGCWTSNGLIRFQPISGIIWRLTNAIDEQDSLYSMSHWL